MQLPDELMDMVSGGVMTLNGESVSSFDIDNTGVTVSTASGSYKMSFSAAEQAQHKQNPGSFNAESAEFGKLFHSTDILGELESSVFQKV